ncbi:MAG: diacylglycerol kinase family protein [Chloroflexota bacterium]
MNDDNQLASEVTDQPLNAKLIFNPSAGSVAESEAQLAELLTQLQTVNIAAEVYLVRPNGRITAVVANAVRRSLPLVIVAGGDGTIDLAARALVGTGTTLGIIPTGTRNNIARSLNIPSAIPEAVALLRHGQRLAMDVGQAISNDHRSYFVEAGAVGLGAALYTAADGLQKGDLGHVGDLLAAFATHAMSHVDITLDDDPPLTAEAHMVLVVNTPYLAANVQLAPDIALDDGQLDVFIYANLNKLDLIGYALNVATGTPQDTRIQHYRAQRVRIRTTPPLSVLVDGYAFGEGDLQVTIRPHALNVMANRLPDSPVKVP